jgi:hypothetical protein
MANWAVEAKHRLLLEAQGRLRLALAGKAAVAGKPQQALLARAGLQDRLQLAVQDKPLAEQRAKLRLAVQDKPLAEQQAKPRAE